MVEIRHGFLVAHRDETFPSGWRPTYSLTLVCKENMHLCHMASTWREPDVIRSTALHGFWWARCHPLQTFELRCAYRYCDDFGASPAFVVDVEMRRHPDSENVYIDQSGKRLFLDIFEASPEDNFVFNALIDAPEVYDDGQYNMILYQRLIGSLVTPDLSPRSPPPSLQ